MQFGLVDGFLSKERIGLYDFFQFFGGSQDDDGGEAEIAVNSLLNLSAQRVRGGRYGLENDISALDIGPDATEAHCRERVAEALH